LINWQSEFKNAHLNSWPVAMLGMSMDIYRRDKKEIDREAKTYGYIKQGETPAHVDFIKWPIVRTESA
jgi:hypothetical protein